jgi:hypothetical protein
LGALDVFTPAFLPLSSLTGALFASAFFPDPLLGFSPANLRISLVLNGLGGALGFVTFAGAGFEDVFFLVTFADAGFRDVFFFVTFSGGPTAFFPPCGFFGGPLVTFGAPSGVVFARRPL